MPSIFLRRPTPPTRVHTGLRGFLFVWLPAILGMIVIAIESTPTFSAAHTSRFLRPFGEFLFGHISDANWDETNHILRKSGHFLGYGTLCLLFFRSWLWTLATNLRLSDGVWRLRAWLLAILSTFVVASCDEIHQSFLPSRTGKFTDVLLDTCGGLILSLLLLALTASKRGKQA